MFKFIKRIFIFFITTAIVLVGGIMYINYRNQENLLKDLTTVSNKENSSDIKDNSTTSSDDTLENIKNLAKDYTIETDSTNISQAISDILSDENKYDIAIKYDNSGALVSLDTVSRKVSMITLDTIDNFKSLASKTDKYIDFDSNKNYNIEDLNTLKDKFLSSGMVEKYEIVKDILKNSDTNIKESDLISMYFNYMASK
ncbi:hypothetical protein EAI30_00045 [Romboutsia ilealis]|uniref:Lipoprotein n=1 Tax=Romboutsia faecis TaxID=2764597 RepID=A0ABR7JMG2_9FIRM|nr:hypothetical protein [Romboutsia faecis]MBC5995796.1 hypothetical protein [Romboutsia faecis]MRN22995.1 hypothetical protein [Romboutsia ilealis]